MAGALLNPDNRLLGWSIGDLGLYGAAVPAGTVPIGETDAAARGETGDDAPPHAATGGSVVAAPVAVSPEFDLSRPALDGPSAAPAAAPSLQFTAPAIAMPLPAGAPADTGSGSVAPVALTTAFASPAASGTDAGSAQPSFQAPFAIQTPPIAATDALSSPAAPVSTQGASDVALVLPSAPIVAPALSTAAPIADGVALADGATAAVTSAPAIASGLVAPLVDAATDVGTAATGLVSAALPATAVDAAGVAPVASAVGSVVQPAAEGVAPIAAVGDAIDALATPAGTASANESSDLLTGVGGTDPAAGVATLVEMVSSADHFDLSQTGGDIAPDGGSIVDLLAVDVADAPLLGAADPHHVDADDDGIGGLGL